MGRIQMLPMSAASRRGSSWERQVSDWLNTLGWKTDRQPRHGRADIGDIAGMPGTVIQCKNWKSFNLAEWVRGMEEQMGNASADMGVVIAKRLGKGSVDDAYAIMPAKLWAQLMKEAGR